MLDAPEGKPALTVASCASAGMIVPTKCLRHVRKVPPFAIPIAVRCVPSALLGRTLRVVETTLATVQHFDGPVARKPLRLLPAQERAVFEPCITPALPQSCRS